jgi:hypothetical protein
MRVYPRRVAFRGESFVSIESKPFELLMASVMLSSASGVIVEAEHVDRLGFRREELVGKKKAVFSDLMPSGTVTERMFVSSQHDPVLTLMSVSRSETTINLHFEVVDHLYAVEFVFDAYGTIRDCSEYSARQLTGHSRKQLIGQSINCIVPELFPSFPLGTKFACQAEHRQGHPFRVTLILYKTGSGQYLCQMRRHIVQLPEGERATDQPGNFELFGVDLGATLGVGSSGTVRLGRLRSDNQKHLAVKFVSKENRVTALHEAEMLKLFRHPNICQMYAVMETATHEAIVMEFCRGVEMSLYIISRPVSMTVDEARHYFWQLVSVIEHIHAAGIVHRDITLHNIIVDAVGKTSIEWRNNSIKLIDFGMACRAAPGTLLESFRGSSAYAAPEIGLDVPFDGFAADIWSLGVVLYCSIVGRFPFAKVSEILTSPVDCTGINDASCAELLAKILTKETKQRVTLPHIKAHPWLSEHSQSLGQVEPSIFVGEDTFATPTKRLRTDWSLASCDDVKLLNLPAVQ